MGRNINCKKNDKGAWCKDKRVKRSLFGLGARCCSVFEGVECPYQEEFSRPDYPQGTNLKWSSYDEFWGWYVSGIGNESRDLTGHANPIVREAFEAGREAKLNACKVCNATSSQILHENERGENPWSIYCNSCGKGEAEVYGKSPADVTKKWNSKND